MFPRFFFFFLAGMSRVRINSGRKSSGGNMESPVWLSLGCLLETSQPRQTNPRFRRKVEPGERNLEASLIPKIFWSLNFLMALIVS